MTPVAHPLVPTVLNAMFLPSFFLSQALPSLQVFPCPGASRPWVGGASGVGGAAVMVNAPQTPSADRASHTTIPEHLPDGCCRQPWVAVAPSHPPSPRGQLNEMAEEQP